jgi:hypothetical protein
MKTKKRFFLTLSVIALAAFAAFGQSPYIHNNFIAIPCCGSGLVPFAEIEIIQNRDELNAYFTKMGCDVSEFTEYPDFSQEMAFGVVTGFCIDHHTSQSRSPEGIVRVNDTFNLIIHSNKYVDSTQELPLGFCCMLITMDKNKLKSTTSVPVFLKEAGTTAIAVKQNKAWPSSSAAKTSQTVMGKCDILGRSLQKHIRPSSGLIIQPSQNGQGKSITVKGAGNISELK